MLPMRLFFLLAILLTSLLSQELWAGEWRLGYTLPKNTAEGKAIQTFADRVHTLSHGSIIIHVYPALQLGDWTFMQERVSDGSLEMSVQPPSSEKDERISIVYFPYLFKNVAMLRKNLACNAPFRQALDELFREQNIHTLAYVPVFFGGLGLKRLPGNWEKPNSFAGFKIRVPNDPSFIFFAQSLGAQPVPITMSDTFSALKIGLVDGVLGFGFFGNYTYHKLIEYYLPLNNFIQLWPVMINLTLWERLNEENRKALSTAALALEEECSRDFVTMDDIYRRKLVNSGVTVLGLSDKVLDGYASYARALWPTLADTIERDWVRRTLAKVVE